MDKFLNFIRNKSIHIVGVTGSEGSSILRFLRKKGMIGITAHDYCPADQIEKSFKLWHKGISIEERNALYRKFLIDLQNTNLQTGSYYLFNITSADIIFVPQSWRLYPRQNNSLWKAKQKGVPFYSLTRLYLDFAPATVIGITGTVGKGSVASIVAQLLLKMGKTVYFAGNETWKVQVADKLDEMKESDILVLEISHRQLLDGITRGPHIALITNIYPNHLDELTYEEYVRAKLSLFKSQKAGDISILNADIPLLSSWAPQLKSEVIYYSFLSPNMNTKSVQFVFPQVMNIKSNHYHENVLAGLTIINSLIIPLEKTLPHISSLESLPARMEKIGEKSGIVFYDDIKSTTPWATIRGLKQFSSKIILICGGNTKGINYEEFIQTIKSNVDIAVCLESPLCRQLSKSLYGQRLHIAKTLKEAIEYAYEKSKSGDKIIVSPAASFFYSKFIRGSQSIKKIVTSLPPKAQEQ